MTCMARSEWGHEPNEVASSYLHHTPQRESSESSKQTMSGKEIAAANDRSGWQVARTVTPPPLSPRNTASPISSGLLLSESADVWSDYATPVNLLGRGGTTGAALRYH